MTFFLALHLILSSYLDVVDTRTRRVMSRILVTRRVRVIFLEAHPYNINADSLQAF